MLIKFREYCRKNPIMGFIIFTIIIILFAFIGIGVIIFLILNPLTVEIIATIVFIYLLYRVFQN